MCLLRKWFWRWWVFTNKQEWKGRMCRTPGRLGLFCPVNAPVRVKILELLKWKPASCCDVDRHSELSASLRTHSLTLHTSSCWLWLFKKLVFYWGWILLKSTPLTYTRWQIRENTFEKNFLSVQRENTISPMMDCEKWKICKVKWSACTRK